MRPEGRRARSTRTGARSPAGHHGACRAETARLPATMAAGASCWFGEPIADAENRFDVRRADLAADVLDVRVDRPLIRFKRDSAHGVEELGAREHAARLARQQSHDLELAFRQVDAAAAESSLHP